ncbi:MAG: pyruvate, phosphate dikinase [Alphaproteobacteria bacterium]|nr:pyruvate, phosphate dikinase [Alphaproteobacteria bacterium]
MTKWVYNFGGGKAEGNATMRNLLGGKGANLAEMNNIGIPVPAGFSITTDVCTYYQKDKKYPDELKQQVNDAVSNIEKVMGGKFGDVTNPVLLSVRSGSRVSMPGMMDTVLNLGLNDETVEGLAKHSGDARFAYDSYRRFIQMYSNVVMGVDGEHFESVLEEVKEKNNYSSDTEITADEWKAVIVRFEDIGKELGKPFPQDPNEQLWGAVSAVFASWNVARAVTYRKLNHIPGNWGTAVNVQAMVFGNAGEDCATGVCFTRDPATGENAYYGEYLVNAQGEDVVAGIRTPRPMSLAAKLEAKSNAPSLEEVMPSLYKELCDVREKLELHYKEMQDMEFTIQHDKLWMLQTRTGKRTAAAALRIAVEMVHEKLITKEEAVLRVEPDSLDQLLHPTIDPEAKRDVIGTGLPASPGAASGMAVFSAEDAEKWHEEGKKVILVRIETSPEDIGGMHVAQGILTARGGMTSHAAVVARGMGRPCVSGAGDVKIDYKTKQFKAGSIVIKEGDIITLDGSTGEIMKGELSMVEPELGGDFGELMAWADEMRTMKVRTNAETPEDAKQALKFGAEGIGLCRTEHMFFDPKRILAMRQMIIADDEAGRRAALAKVLPYQRQDFVDLFTIMEGLPITIRLLDPPLHEFLPHTLEEQAEIAKDLGVDVALITESVTSLHESNPMLGHRGCRLGITYPEIYEMQAQAIFEAAVEVFKKTGSTIVPEVMIPLVGHKLELEMMREVVDVTAKKILKEAGVEMEYQIGTMIELPRACLTADKIAESAEFFSFGTNDLTQTTLGMSRDDSGAFLKIYQDKGIYERDLFASIDVDGVGEMVRIAVEKGKATRPNIKLGICGEHGGDPKSIDFCQSVGLNYVSCSPFRVPVARLAAAHSAYNAKKA